jgi:GT2 family glycosyltransferase
MTLGVVTVTYNAAGHLQPFLESCAAQRPGDFELLVIDNASADATVSIANELRDPRTTVLANKTNVGYAAACNQGIHYFTERGVDEILFINNDTVFAPTLFAELVSERRAHQADAVTPRITYFSEPERNWYAGGRFSFWKGFQGEHLGEGKYHQANDDSPRWTEVAPGCCILFATDVFRRIGVFDENYFVYFEDTDYFLRMKRAGLRLLYAPGSIILHKVSLSTGGWDSVFSIHHYQRGQIYLLRKHFGVATQCLQLVIIVAKALVRMALGHEPPRKTLVRLRAIYDGLLMPSYEKTLGKRRSQ